MVFGLLVLILRELGDLSRPTLPLFGPSAGEGDNGLLPPLTARLHVLSELVGGKLAIRLAPVLGGCGNDAIDTARRGTKFLASVSTGNEGVEGRCNDPETFRGVCGRREAFRRFWVDARLEREFGKAGRADVGG